MSLDSMQDLLVDQLRDLYSAENQLIKALPKMAKAASSPALKKAFESHLEETRTHAERLAEIFKTFEERPTGKKCKAMEGLIEEGSEIIGEDGAEAVLDAGMIGAAQKVEHYEIAAYGTAITHAELLGLARVAKILKQTLAEEEAADKKLTQIAESEVNEEALAVAGVDSDE